MLLERLKNLFKTPKAIEIKWVDKFFLVAERAKSFGWDGKYGFLGLCTWAKLKSLQFLGVKSNTQLLLALNLIEIYIQRLENERR